MSHIHRRRNALPKKTLKVIVETRNEAILQVKGNQPKLLEDCERIGRNAEINDEHKTLDTCRNREEERTVQVFKKFTFRTEVKKKRGKYIKSIIKVTRRVKKFDTKEKKWMLSVEESYYISTKIYSAKKSGKTIREHWGIENISHYVKDVSMGEDQSRIRVNPNIMSKMRSRGLNVLRTKGIKNVKRELSENKMDFYRFHKRYLRFI